jgi:hypothetical protein
VKDGGFFVTEKRNLHGSTHPAWLINADKALDTFEGDNDLVFEWSKTGWITQFKSLPKIK